MRSFEVNQNIHVNQQFLLSLSMQKALFILQMPIMELKEWLEQELSTNPILEKIEGLSQRSDSYSCIGQQIHSSLYNLEELTPQPISLYEHMLHQCRLSFSNPEDLWIANQIIGNLDQNGFFTEIPDELSSLEDLEKIESILDKIHKMDPPGIGARSIQESLLLQLIALNKQNTLTYWIIDNYYTELLEQKFSFLGKKFHLSTNLIQTTIQKELSLLDPYPGLRFIEKINPPLIPDVIIEQIEGTWVIRTNDTALSAFRLNPRYQEAYPTLCQADQKFFLTHYNSAKWISRSIKKRNTTLSGVVKYIIKKQTSFFDKGNNELVPMTYEEIAQALEMNQSTIARAVTQKTLMCEQGIFPLKFFFSSSSNKQSKMVSSHNAKQLLQKMICEENKDAPLSDTELVDKMRKKGFQCARRTVAKYRQSLKIAPASHRRLFRIKKD
ncbi:MAG: RNA polymerase sigma-54 factor [Chlamydiia bacterium]|nr:RNA polymerase sigma-54 factor [Chlamydiia bacterium]